MRAEEFALVELSGTAALRLYSRDEAAAFACLKDFAYRNLHAGAESIMQVQGA